MPFTQNLILSVPLLLLGLGFILISAIVAVFGVILMRRIIHHKKLKVHNDIAGPLFGAMAVVYAVLLAFVVVATWESFDRSKLNAEKEASCLMDLYTDSESFSQPQKAQIRILLRDYTLAIVKEEWLLLKVGKPSSLVDGKLKEIRLIYSNYLPKNETDKVFFSESISKLNSVCELRRMRIVDSQTGIHPLLWFVLIAGGFGTIIFSFFFGTENLGAQLMMTALFAALIALILFTILEMDFPFSGSVSISSDAFVRALDYLK